MQADHPKHGLAAGLDTAPPSADWTIPQGWEAYSAAQHAIWKVLFERQTKILPGRACDEFIAGMRALPLSADQIPDFRRVNDTLCKRTGWTIVAVPGLVPDEVFFGTLPTAASPPAISFASRISSITSRSRMSSMICSAMCRC